MVNYFHFAIAALGNSKWFNLRCLVCRRGRRAEKECRKFFKSKMGFKNESLGTYKRIIIKKKDNMLPTKKANAWSRVLHKS